MIDDLIRASKAQAGQKEPKTFDLFSDSNDLSHQGRPNFKRMSRTEKAVVCR